MLVSVDIVSRVFRIKNTSCINISIAYYDPPLLRILAHILALVSFTMQPVFSYRARVMASGDT